MPVAESHVLPAVVLDKSAGSMGDVSDAPVDPRPVRSSFDIPHPIYSVALAAPGILQDGQLLAWSILAASPPVESALELLEV
jgi:hypothetical protein